MSKDIYNIEDRIAIEEFIFVAETSSIIISEIVPKRFSLIFEELLTLIMIGGKTELLSIIIIIIEFYILIMIK